MYPYACSLYSRLLHTVCNVLYMTRIPECKYGEDGINGNGINGTSQVDGEWRDAHVKLICIIMRTYAYLKLCILLRICIVGIPIRIHTAVRIDLDLRIYSNKS